MPKADIEAAPVCPSFNSFCTDQLEDLAAKVFREFDNLELLVESKSTSNMQKEGPEPGLLLPCPGFTPYCCSEQTADIAEDLFELITLENKSEEDNDFTFDIPKWGQKFFFGPVFPVFNRDFLLEQMSSAGEEKSKQSTTNGTASPAPKMKLSELFQQVDGRSFVMPTSTSKTKRSSAYDWKLSRRTNGEGETMSKKKPQRRTWVDRCIERMRQCLWSS